MSIVHYDSMKILVHCDKKEPEVWNGEFCLKEQVRIKGFCQNMGDVDASPSQYNRISADTFAKVIEATEKNDDNFVMNIETDIEINSQGLEGTQIRYILQKYSFDKYTCERAFKPPYTFSSI